MWKPALGGLILGVLALAFPQVHEQASYHVLTELFTLSSVTLVFLTMLIGAKIVATSLTVGSGGSGGILAPSLFIGALLGSIYGKAMAYLFPTLALGGVPAMVIGMGAVFAGTAHAPLTAIALIFEFTDSYLLLAPLVIACFVSAFIAQSVGKQSMYSAHIPHRLKLKR
jgi:CIC family chloride channel protein